MTAFTGSELFFPRRYTWTGTKQDQPGSAFASEGSGNMKAAGAVAGFTAMLPVRGGRVGGIAMRGCSDGLVKVARVAVVATLDTIPGKNGTTGILQPGCARRRLCLTGHKQKTGQYHHQSSKAGFIAWPLANILHCFNQVRTSPEVSANCEVSELPSESISIRSCDEDDVVIRGALAQGQHIGERVGNHIVEAKIICLEVAAFQ